ncbi:MAG: beta-ketoacyl-ACP synthase III [Lachnospiraceae bacterium]
MTSRVIGTGSYLPEIVVTNDDLAKMIETNDEWISSRTGIRSRRITPDQTIGTTYMSIEASRRALKNAGVSAEDIDIIILATSSPDNCFPAGACEVQAAIGAVNAVAFDISAACAGFIFAMNTVQAFIKAGIYKTALIIGTDTLSKLMDWEDRSTCILFGDGAGAAVIQADETGLLQMVMGSDGVKGPVLSCVARTNDNFLTGKQPEIGYTNMDGQEVFKFAVKKVPECISQVLEQAGAEADDVDYFVLHQANARIVDSVAKRLKQPIEKFPMNIDRYGNTSAASIPILLDEMNQEGRLNAGARIVIAGFGAGLTWGAALLDW